MGKMIFKNFHFFKNNKKNPRAEDNFDYAIAMLRHSVSEYWL